MEKLNFLIDAAGNTISLAVFSLVFGLILAMLFAVWESVRLRPISWLCTAFVTVIRGLPEILVVLSIYFGLPMLYLLFIDGFTLNLYFTEVPIQLNVSDPNATITPFWCGVVALSLLYASYGSQTLRGAIKAVPYGQWESGYALGLSGSAIFFRLIIPQMWKHALPGLGNQWLVLLKDTALVSIIGVNDIMRQTESIISHTKAPFSGYLLAAAIYLLITLVSQSILTRIELHASRFERRGN